MRNRFKRASYAVAAGVTVAATIGLSAVGPSAAVKPGATTACSFHCIDVSFQNPGLGDILAAHSGLAEVNNIVRLVPGSNGNSKSDFSRKRTPVRIDEFKKMRADGELSPNSHSLGTQ